LSNSDCYKFTDGGAWKMPWQALAYSLTGPGFKSASPFMGLMVAVLMPFSFAGNGRHRILPIAVLWLVSIMVSSQIWPLNLLFQHPPFSYVITIYAMPIYLLASAVIAGMGLEALVENITGSRRKLVFAGLA